MPIGLSNGNNSDRKDQNSIYVYSRVKLVDAEERLFLSMTFNSGLMNINIEDRTIPAERGYGNERIANACLSITKAYIMVNQIDALISDIENDTIDENKAYGVRGGMRDVTSYICVRAKKDKTIILQIGDYKSSTNKILTSTEFVFKKEYNYGLVWNNISKDNPIFQYNDLIELRMLRDAIYGFATNAAGGAAAAVWDGGRYRVASIENSIKQLYEASGISMPHNNYNSSYGSKASTSSSVDNRSIEEIQDMI